MDIRWKQAPGPNKPISPKRSKAGSASHNHQSNTNDRLNESTQLDAINLTDPNTGFHQQPLPLHDGSEHLLELDLPTPNINQGTMNVLTPRSVGILFPDLNAAATQATPTPDRAIHSSNTSPPGAAENAQINAIDYDHELWNMERFWEDYLKAVPSTPSMPNISAGGSEALAEPYSDREEYITTAFRHEICHKLSIEEDSKQNPWWNLVWPLAVDHPAVYNAIAALTCFGTNGGSSHQRSDGTQYLHRSTQSLSEQMEKGNIPLNAALAATLALGFAETWDYDNSSGGSMHIRGGGLLLQQIISNHENVSFGDVEQSRIRFLAHTWTYMDALARFTCGELSHPYHGGVSAPDLTVFATDPSNLDPLMGYATTLFPVIRNVADLINKARAREVARNSPAIISQALELRSIIERWSLPIDLEAIDDEPSQLMTDAIQTAEAYRWSALLMLYQTVPELPNLTSYGELAQKILVYLATIPLSSSTSMTHAFPLMVAGCDAVEEEDRQFVRDRWNAMSQRMVPGVVHRCLRVTEEIWKRREEYLWSRGLSFTANGRQVNTTMNESTTLSKDIASFINFGTSPGASSSGSTERLARKGNDFPISAAFKKGVDMLTRSGCTEYTVRGRLHWLGVMKDWNWQFMLG
ncbi:fungal-specific transcription factor domain-containing protein [Paraphoma chrysanthemicola]|uniref:Fungal-specific transcription factor domain-containing protein n=1 Tax=Paraphoma chrysanthemicola TaxID=798071 RepID=A0A8K0QY40_9PLEO|nr:fungal-specific transcription factor domain-containing protein [Paraphoma chrysanthemicola]